MTETTPINTPTSTKESQQEVIQRIESALNVKFSESQLEAIIHTGAPLNILSCAGSGKTTTLIGKMLFMEMYYNISPASILAITFNKEAIDDMEKRYFTTRYKLGLNKRFKITFKTYHALYYLILNSKFSTCSWNSVCSYTKFTWQLNQIITKLCYGFKPEILEQLMGLRSLQISNLLTKEELYNSMEFAIAKVNPKVYEAVTTEYEKLKKESNCIDFEDLQILMYEEIKKNPSILNTIHGAWEYIVVDEYQDICKVQLEILKLIIKDTNKLTAIGDDDQAIYEFRGSKTEYIIDFCVHFLRAERIVMSTNYRVPKTILNPITQSINRNMKRVQKGISASTEGGRLEYTSTSGSFQSAKLIGEEIRRLQSEGVPLDDIMILIRNNNQQRIILDYFLQNDIPTSTKSAMTLDKHFIVQDLKNIVEMALNEKDYYFFNKANKKIMPYLNFNVAKYVSKKMEENHESWRELLSEQNNDYIHTASALLYRVESLVKEGAPFKSILEVIQPVYRNHLKYLVEKRGADAYEIADVLEYMKELGSELTFEKVYKEFGRKELLKRFYETNQENTISISTMHGTKGLEFQHVFLLDLTENILPNAKAEENLINNFGEVAALDYIEQERRLFYVAWTRAKKYLNVMVNERNPSRFILETMEEQELDTHIIEEIQFKN